MPTPFAICMDRDAGQVIGSQLACAPDEHREFAVVVADAGGTIRYVSVNFDSLCGYSRHELLGKSVVDLRTGRHDAVFFEAVHDALSSGKPWTGTFSVSRGGGPTRMESATVCAVSDASGVVRQCVGVRREVFGDGLRGEGVRDALATEAVARLVAGMAHDFNNLLTCIIGCSDFLLDRLAGDAAARCSLNEIREAGERAAALARQLLAFGRQQAMMPKVLDLNALVGTLGRGIRAQSGERIEVLIDLAEEPGTVIADPDQVAQVIVTLAGHARDAMPSGGRLTFVTRNVRFDAPHVREGVHVPAGDYVMLAVSDTGRGVDASPGDRLSELFRATGTNAPGLGLAAVYGIVKQSGGHVWAVRRPGHGTTFEICLPRVHRVPGPAGAVRDGAVAPPGSTSLRGQHGASEESNRAARRAI